MMLSSSSSSIVRVADPLLAEDGGVDRIGVEHGDPVEFAGEPLRPDAVPLEEADREAAADQQLADPRRGAVAAHHHDPPPPQVGAAEERPGAAQCVAMGHQEDRVVGLDDRGSVRDERLGSPHHRGEADARRQGHLRERATHALGRGLHLELLHLDLAPRETLHRRGGGIAEGLGDRHRRRVLRADQVVDAQTIGVVELRLLDVGEVVHPRHGPLGAELLRDRGGEQVDLVAVGGEEHQVGVRRTRLRQDIRAAAVALERPDVQILLEGPEAFRAGIDHGHGVAAAVEHLACVGTDLAGAADDDLHGRDAVYGSGEDPPGRPQRGLRKRSIRPGIAASAPRRRRSPGSRSIRCCNRSPSPMGP
jgi:hypothetical protein